MDHMVGAGKRAKVEGIPYEEVISSVVRAVHMFWIGKAEEAANVVIFLA